MSDLSTPKAFIVNAERVTHVYGEWPTFHDSEVLSLSLDRGKQPELQPTMTVRVWTFMLHRGRRTRKVTIHGLATPLLRFCSSGRMI